jgi:regulatory protein
VKITDIKRQKRRNNRFSIYLDRKYAFSLDYDTLARSNIHIGDEITEKQRDTLIAKDEFFRARDYAYSLLSYRDRTEFELKTRLLQKGIHRDVVQEVLDFLMRQNLVDDRAFVVKWIDNVIANRPMGRMRIEHELKRMRLNESIIQEVCEGKLGEETESALAREAAEKKLRVLENYQKEEAERKFVSYLRNRGFRFDIIRDLKKEFFGDNVT